MSDKQPRAAVAARPATKAATETFLRARGFSKARVDAAKTKDLAPMLRELHGVSDAEYQAAKR